jgi:dissimilatory sulfite reductase (desulfoviridin) alpha/beta subunit
VAEREVVVRVFLGGKGGRMVELTQWAAQSPETKDAYKNLVAVVWAEVWKHDDPLRAEDV